MYVYLSFLGGFGENIFVGCTVLMSLYFYLVEAPGAVNIPYFARKLLSAIYKFFIRSFIQKDFYL